MAPGAYRARGQINNGPCIAHPFLDMIDILHEKDAALQVRLRDAYLAEWTAYEPIERLLVHLGVSKTVNQ